MPLQNWKTTQRERESLLLTSSREFFERFDDSIRFRDIPSQVFFWVTSLLVVFTVTKALLSRYSSAYAKLDYKRRISTVCYAVQLIVTTFALVIMVHFGKGALVYERLAHHSIGEARIQDWGEDLDWTVAMDRVLIAAGFGLFPILCWYILELALLAAVGCASIWIVTHHISCIILTVYIIAPAVQCADLLYFRLGFVITMHALMEQPQFLALLLHRLNAVRRLDLVFAGACVYSVFHRVALLGACLWIYADIAWLRSVYSEWDLLHRWLLPPTIVLLFFMQIYPVHVYFTMYRQHKQRLAALAEESDDQSTSSGAAGADQVQMQVISDKAALQAVGVVYDKMLAVVPSSSGPLQPSSLSISVASTETGAAPSPRSSFEFMPPGMTLS